MYLQALVKVVCLLSQAVRAAIEERRPLVEKSLDTGRLYIRSDDDDSRTAESGDGMSTVHPVCHVACCAVPH